MTFVMLCRKLVELLTCLQTFEAMADHSIDAALKGLQSTLADGQQAAVLKGSVDQLLEQTQRLASQASIGSTVTKMSSLCQTLQQEQARMQLPEMTDALAFLSQPKFRALVQTQTIKELVQIVDTKVLHELFSDSCLCKDVLHHTNSAKFTTFLEENRLINRREVLQDGDSFIGQFHSIRGSQFHWG